MQRRVFGNDRFACRRRKQRHVLIETDEHEQHDAIRRNHRQRFDRFGRKKGLCETNLERIQFENFITTVNTIYLIYLICFPLFR